MLKMEVKGVLEGEYGSSSWRVEKAKEVDLINGNDEAMKALALEKKAIRDKGNAIESEILALDPTVAADAKKLISYDVTEKMNS